MQQTKFDQWLKECFIHETHILTLRLPEEKLGRGVVVTDLEQSSKGDYRHKLVIKSRKKSDAVIKLLKENHLMHATHVIDGKHWYNGFLAPEGKSFTLRWILRFIGLILLASFISFVMLLFQNETLMQTLRETINDFE